MTGIDQILPFLPPPPYLITGATGFIGRRLMETLESRHVPLHVLVRNPDKLGVRPDSTRVFQGDITRKHDLDQAMECCSAVFHLASFVDIWAPDPSVFYQINTEGTRNVCEMALQKGIQRMVYTSTAGILGDSRSGIVLNELSEPPGPPMNDYEASKRAAGQVVQDFVLNGLPVIIVMPSRVFGPGSREKSNGYALAMESYAQGKLRFIPGTGNEIGNYAFVDDVVRGHLQAMAFGSSGERYIMGGENIRFRDVFRTVAAVTGKSYRMIPIPYFILYAFAQAGMLYSRITGRRPPVTPEYTRRFRIDYKLDLTKSTTELGYRVTPFKDGVTLTLAGLQTHSTNI